MLGVDYPQIAYDVSCRNNVVSQIKVICRSRIRGRYVRFCEKDGHKPHPTRCGTVQPNIRVNWSQGVILKVTSDAPAVLKCVAPSSFFSSPINQLYTYPRAKQLLQYFYLKVPLPPGLQRHNRFYQTTPPTF
jgi:hypothetical protein